MTSHKIEVSEFIFSTGIIQGQNVFGFPNFQPYNNVREGDSIVFFSPGCGQVETVAKRIEIYPNFKLMLISEGVKNVCPHMGSADTDYDNYEDFVNDAEKFFTDKYKIKELTAKDINNFDWENNDLDYPVISIHVEPYL